MQQDSYNTKLITVCTKNIGNSPVSLKAHCNVLASSGSIVWLAVCIASFSTDGTVVNRNQ